MGTALVDASATLHCVRRVCQRTLVLRHEEGFACRDAACCVLARRAKKDELWFRPLINYPQLANIQLTSPTNWPVS